MHPSVSFSQYQAILEQPVLSEEYNILTGTPYLCVDATGFEHETLPGRLPSCPVIGVSAYDGTLPKGSVFDLLTSPEGLATLAPILDSQALAVATLVQLLRHNEQADTVSGLLAESLAYSTLQQSSGFQNWLQSAQAPANKADAEPQLLIEHTERTLTLTLNRPHAHNAYNAALKDALCSALMTAYAGDVQKVTLRGQGPSFCAGGDLSEFGQVNDAAEAHHSRVVRSAAALLDGLSCSTEAHLHGACIGAGIELPSFTNHISAHPDSFFQLPEIAMGLVPGAGGTVGICRRIGRQRTAWLAISNQQLDVTTAQRWGLVDEVDAL